MQDIIYGLNPVINALEGSRKPTKVFISETLKNKEVERLCLEYDIPFVKSTRHELDRMTHGANNQGVCCYVEPFVYSTLQDVIRTNYDDAQASVLVLDGIEDPVNFGSLLRTACCFNFKAVIIAKDRQVGMTPTVIKLSTGASEHIMVAQVSNISQSLIELKKNGYWVVAADGHGDKLFDEVDYGGKIALVIGSEGRGISRLVLRESDFIARIPISGPITSLNAHVAGAIFMSAIASHKAKKN